MSSEEPKYAKFLDDNHIEYIPQYEVYCTFTRNKLHKVDFFLPKQNLYVEVKGFMTLYAINTLRFYLEHSPLNFMLLQMTEFPSVFKAEYYIYIAKLNIYIHTHTHKHIYIFSLAYHI